MSTLWQFVLVLNKSKILDICVYMYMYVCMYVYYLVDMSWLDVHGSVEDWSQCNFGLQYPKG